MDFLNSQIGRRWNYDTPFLTENQHILGAMVPARASTGYDYEASEEIDGSTVCLTEVVPWPFSEDDEGVSFDQGSLYGVRTLTWRRPLADGGGDKEWWTAVPRTLPGGYTAVGRCGILVPGVYGDHLAGIESNSVTWNHRTPGGFLWDTSNALETLRGTWAPMNLNQRVYHIDVSDIYSTMWSYFMDDATDPESGGWLVAVIATNHVGFRGGRVEVTFSADSMENFWPHSGSVTLEVAALRADKVWDPMDADTGDQPEVIDTVSIGYSFALPTDPPVTTSHSLGDLRPTGIGVPFNFFLRYRFEWDTVNNVPDPYPAVFRTRHNTFLSPRTDVPLFYIATMGNRVAPGGIVMP